MTHTITALKHRDILLMINDVEESNFNVFSVTKEMMNSLKYKAITSQQYEALASELEYQCNKYGVPTSNELISLF